MTQGERSECVGPYELMDTLGRGNFGKVKRARHLQTEEMFAVKIVEKSVLHDNVSGNMDIRREMSILRALDHPNIIRLHEVMESKRRVYLVMDLASGGDFYDLLLTHGRFNEDEARSFFAQLVSAITHCHAHGVFHRDLKPENLLLDAGGTLQVTDFGFGAMKDREGTLLRTSCGSPHYCAPEVWGSDNGYDGRKSDAFSVGVILYVLVVGGQPFNDPCEREVLRKVSECKAKYPAHLSEEVVDLLGRLLVKDPKQRWDLDMVRTHPWFMGVSFSEALSYEDVGSEDSVTPGLSKGEGEACKAYVLVGGCADEHLAYPDLECGLYGKDGNVEPGRCNPKAQARHEGIDEKCLLIL